MNHVLSRSLLSGLIFCGLAMVGTASAQGDPSAIFATVNGENIKSGEFWHRLAWYRIDPSNPLAKLPAGFLALNQLITEHLVFDLARDKGCSPTDGEVDAELKRKEAEDPTIVPGLKAEGRPESDLYDEVKYNLAEYKLRTFGILITDQQVEQHYKDYPGEYTSPKQFKLKVIVVNSDEESSAVDQELAAGKAFADVAKDHSLDVSKGKGGDFGIVGISRLAGPAADALNAIKIGGTTGWLTGGQGSAYKVKYFLVDTYPATLHPLDEALRDQIRRKMSLDKGAVKNSLSSDLQSASISAKVVINQPGFQKIYDEMISSFTKIHPSGG